MIRLKQHRPAYIDTDQALMVAEAENTTALLAHPWIAWWGQDMPYAKNGVIGHKKFHQFSLADRDCRPSLMAEYENGDEFWVIGHITEGAEQIELPDWRETEAARLRRERWNQGITD